MEDIKKLCARLLWCIRGNMLFEYVVLTQCLLIMVMGASEVFNPAGAYTGDFGELGNAFVDWIRRLMIGIALPFP